MTDIPDTDRGLQDDEIDLLQLIKTLWVGRKTIIKYVIIFAFIGLLIALLSSKEYTTTVTIVPQVERGQSGLGNLPGFVSLPGINLNTGTGESNYISPKVYPQIISSIPFNLELMSTMISIEKIDHPISVFDYYTMHVKPNPIIKYTLGLPRIILESFQKKSEVEQPTEIKSEIIQLTKAQKKVIDILNDLVSVKLNEKEGYIDLICKMPKALPSAQLAQKAQELLQQRITEFKIQKAAANLDFIQSRYNDVLKQYNNAQEALAKFRDQNKYVSTAMAQTELQSLVNDYNLTHSIYSEIAKQLEQAKIKVKEDTPVFTIIEPASVPMQKSKPRRTLILIVFIFLGGMIGSAISIGRSFLPTLKQNWNNK